MILVIDNYDSFTYNLVQRLGEIGATEIEVFRNDKITLKEAEAREPDHIIISPGPCTPLEAGISNEVIRHFAGRKPILGVCLGHQCIGHVYGGKVERARRLMHGKTSPVHHDGKTIFQDLENPFVATRYHSLWVRRDTLPEEFDVTAWADDDEVMGIRHREYPLEGVQFHPESIMMRPHGIKMIANFLKL